LLSTKKKQRKQISENRKTKKENVKRIKKQSALQEELNHGRLCKNMKQ